MVLSKVYSGSEERTIKEFRFRSFGESESFAPLEAAAFEPSVQGDSKTAHPPLLQPDLSSPIIMPEAPNDLQQRLEEAQALGRQEGLAQAEERFEDTSRALAQALEDVSRLRESLAQSGSQDMLRLVMAVAEQIVRRTIEVDPNVVLTTVENALQASVRSDSYRVSINPEDLEVVNAQKPLFIASISGLQNLSFDADASISRGGCRIDSELGDVDATIESQLDAIRQALATAITEE